VLIYPNPGSEYISIYSINENDIIYKIEIVDIIGRIHYSWNSNDFLENPFSINLSTFISGIYFIKIYNQNGVIVRKIVKK
jgi:hypothetical protein